MSRPTWPKVWMTEAHNVARMSTCPRAQAGAVLVTPEWQVLTTGFNGAPRRLDHCTEVGCLIEGTHCLRAVHAEANALMQAARLGIAVRGSLCYCTHRPCQRCMGLLIQAGVVGVYYALDYDSDDQRVALGMAAKAGLELGVIR